MIWAEIVTVASPVRISSESFGTWSFPASSSSRSPRVFVRRSNLFFKAPEIGITYLLVLFHCHTALSHNHFHIVLRECCLGLHVEMETCFGVASFSRLMNDYRSLQSHKKIFGNSADRLPRSPTRGRSWTCQQACTTPAVRFHYNPI